MIRKCLIVFIFLAIFLIPQKANAISTSGLIINEYQTGPDSDQFIELHNPTNTRVSLSGLKIEHKAATGSAWNNMVTLKGDVEAGGYYLIASVGYPNVTINQIDALGMENGGGHLRIYSQDGGIEHDLVGWGNAVAPDKTAALKTANGQSSKRHVDKNGRSFDSNNNGLDFYVSNSPTPGTGGIIDLSEPEDPELPEVSVEAYLPIDITELFPDPVSPQTDANDEFVELYNPNNESVSLEGYVLQTGSSFNYKFTLPDVELAANQYLAIISSDSSLTLSNSGGNARILDPKGEQQGIAEEYSQAKSAQSWVKFNEGWAWTEKTTPGAKNELVISVGDAELVNTTSDKSLISCRSDQFRNPETNRCKLKSSSSSSLTPCKAGQTRNTETNRCRSTASFGSSGLKACAADQFRNPETNRCKKLSSASSSLKACGEGQERSKDTNRCRKLAGNNKADVTDAAAVLSTDKVKQNLPLIAVIGGGSVIYALYEFRYDIRNKFAKARGYLGSRTTSGRDP
ncbi:lamin tail domain-containing protein [Candidatus Saccharibacteria bacterium]|nr:lamin tail domain-containing protein [Candidatus Saccharibacteria bacterium]